MLHLKNDIHQPKTETTLLTLHYQPSESINPAEFTYKLQHQPGKTRHEKIHNQKEIQKSSLRALNFETER